MMMMIIIIINVITIIIQNPQATGPSPGHYERADLFMNPSNGSKERVYSMV